MSENVFAVIGSSSLQAFQAIAKGKMVIGYDKISAVCCLILCVFIIMKVSGECNKDVSCNATVTVEWHCGVGYNAVSCCSLNAALNYTANQTAICSRKSRQLSVAIHLNSSTENLSKSSIHTFTGNNISHLVLCGTQDYTIINCEKGAALKFEGTTRSDTQLNVQIHNISFQACGNGIAALYFSGNYHIKLHHVVIAKSNGSGLSLVNVSRRVQVSKSLFENNSLHGSFGAGVHINISTEDNEQLLEGHEPEFDFTCCNFTGNRVLDATSTLSDAIEVGGGGMFVTLTGVTHDVNIRVDNCMFSNNEADRGAGFSAIISDNASRNTLTITATWFEGNHYSSNANPYNAGGGAMVTTSARSSSNTILIQDCTFSGNNASWGGAIEIDSSPSNPTGEHNLNYINVTRCIFTNNMAAIGAAINIYCRSAPTAPEFCNTVPNISYSNFSNNGNSVIVENKFTVSILNIDSFPTYLMGILFFTNNIGTPLYIHETAVIVTENSHLKFTNNTAQNGGAIALYGSWIAVSKNSKFLFNNNTAIGKGGAIYVHQSKELYVPYAHNCFIRYYSNSSQSTPWEWQSHFDFRGNKAANKNNSIYATSIIPCVWKDKTTLYSSTSDDLRATFCNWTNWKFSGNCSKQITTSARNFSSTDKVVYLSPGVPNPFVYGVDDLGHKVNNLSVTAIVWPPAQGTKYSVQYTDNGVTVFGKSNRTLYLLLQINGNRDVSMIVNVILGDCPPGFIFHSDSLSCRCIVNKRSILHCDDFKAYIMNSYCITYSKINYVNQTVIGRCVFTAIVNTGAPSPFILLPGKEQDLDEKFCGTMNRTGRLCGKCAEGLSIDVFSNTFRCRNCLSSVGRNWVIFIAIEGLPPLALFMAIILLHISLTSGPANGFIFYSQVLTLSQEVMIVESTLKVFKFPRVIANFMVDSYSVWSLDFYRIYNSFTQGNHPLCLNEQFGVIHVLALRYLSALYPFCLIVVAYVLIELHARNCRVLVWMWKPLCILCVRFRQSWKAQTSVVDAFATFIVLAYVRLVRISFLLVTYTNVYNMAGSVVIRVTNYDPAIRYLSRQHAPFAAMGAFFLLTFGVTPMVLLLVYQLKIVQRFLNKCRLNRLGLKTFMDAFQGCYKDGRNGGPDRRYFAGLYLLFRVIIFATFNSDLSKITLYFCLLIECNIFAMITSFLQPYKIKFYNNLDIFFFHLLTLIFGLHVLGFSELDIMLTVPKVTPILTCCLGTIPLLYMAGFVQLRLLYQICRSRSCERFMTKIRNTKWCSKTSPPTTVDRNSSNSEPLVTYSEVNVKTDEHIPDRLVNSFRYNSTRRFPQLNTQESGYGSINN